MYIPGPTKASRRLWKCSGPKQITSSRIKRAILRAQLQEFKPFIDFFHSELLFQGLGALHIELGAVPITVNLGADLHELAAMNH